MENRLKHVAKAKTENQDRKILLSYLQRQGDKPLDIRPAGPPTDDPLAALRQREEELLQIWAKDHPQVVEVRRQIEALRRKSPVSGANGPAADELIEFYVQAIKHEIDAIQIQMDFLEESLKTDRKTVQDVEGLQHEETLLADRRDRLRKRLTDLEDRQKQLALVQQAQLYDARMINPPTPGGKVAPVLFQCLLLAVALGLAAGAGSAYLAELTDKSFRTPAEIRRRLGLPVIGHIPPDPRRKAADEPAQPGRGADVVCPPPAEVDRGRGVPRRADASCTSAPRAAATRSFR